MSSISAAAITTGWFTVSMGSSGVTSGANSMVRGSRSGRSMRSHSSALPTVSTTRCTRGADAGLSTRWGRQVSNTQTSSVAMCVVSPSTSNTTSGVVTIGACTRR